MMTSETRAPSTPARSSAALIAVRPSSWAGTAGEGAVEGADRRARGADDDDVVFHGKLLPGIGLGRMRTGPQALSYMS